jgi:stage III sporulation protein AG
MVTYASEVTASDDNTVTGVVVVASGANDIGVRLNLLQAVQTALKIDPRYVDIFTKK